MPRMALHPDAAKQRLIKKMYFVRRNTLSPRCGKNALVNDALCFLNVERRCMDYRVCSIVRSGYASVDDLICSDEYLNV
jgi:hypothetical protein